METNGRRLIGRLADGLPEARHEALLALLRACVCLISAIMVPYAATDPDLVVLPSLVYLVLGLLSVAAAVVLARQSTPERARSLGRWSTAADVVFFLAFATAFSDRPGAGGLYGVFVLLIGPVRYGRRGLFATSVPVAVVALLMPQTDAHGGTMPRSEIVLLCVLFTLPALVVRAVTARGSARLRQAEQQFSTAFEHASIGMALADPDLHVLQANRSLGVLLGASPKSLLGSRLDEAVDESD